VVSVPIGKHDLHMFRRGLLFYEGSLTSTGHHPSTGE
jgi:hypothetical protein